MQPHVKLMVAGNLDLALHSTTQNRFTLLLTHRLLSDKYKGPSLPFHIDFITYLALFRTAAVVLTDIHKSRPVLYAFRNSIELFIGFLAIALLVCYGI